MLITRKGLFDKYVKIMSLSSHGAVHYQTPSDINLECQECVFRNFFILANTLSQISYLKTCILSQIPLYLATIIFSYEFEYSYWSLTWLRFYYFPKNTIKPDRTWIYLLETLRSMFYPQKASLTHLLLYFTGYKSVSASDKLSGKAYLTFIYVRT